MTVENLHNPDVDAYLSSLCKDCYGEPQVVRNRISRNIGRRVSNRKIKLPARYIQELKLYSDAARITAAEVVRTALMIYLHEPFLLDHVEIRRPKVFTLSFSKAYAEQLKSITAPGDMRPYNESVAERYGQIMLTIAPPKELAMFISYVESGEWWLNFFRHFAGLPPLMIWDHTQWMRQRRHRQVA